MFDRLRAFLGKPCKIGDFNIYSPTINSIAEIGELTYHLHLIFATFDKEKIMKKIYEIEEEDYEKIKNEDDYKTLILFPNIVHEIEKALSFFFRDNVFFDVYTLTFKINDKVIVSDKNYTQVSSIIKKLNGIDDTEKNEEKKVKFKSERARKMYEEMRKRENERKEAKGEMLDLKDTCSILCNTNGNGINVFNIGQLTIYQVYEHFERMQIKENHQRILKVWANDRSLGEKEKLPEWIVKTKL